MSKIEKYAPTIVGIIILAVLMIIPTGFENPDLHRHTERVSARVISTNESAIRVSGLVMYGEQVCEVRLTSGRFKGETVSGINMLSGSLDSDKIFNSGDRALVLVRFSEGEILSVLMLDHYRLPSHILLGLLFVALIVIFAGATGARAVLSFAVTILAIWKVLVPALLNGINPVGIGLLFAACITVLTIALVYGFNYRCAAASSGALLGIITAYVIGSLFTNLMNVHGAIMDYSQSLLYSGYEFLNLTEIFKASIFIGAAGAMTDLAVDITSAVNEVVEQVPDIKWQAAVKSGFNVGRNAMGTMVTTLLLAYSGGYIVLLMTFMAQGTPVHTILNYRGVSAEILETLAGSIGLVTVAPFTAITSGVLLTLKNNRSNP